jgi:hypothetical protein
MIYGTVPFAVYLEYVGLFLKYETHLRPFERLCLSQLYPNGLGTEKLVFSFELRPHDGLSRYGERLAPSPPRWGSTIETIILSPSGLS